MVGMEERYKKYIEKAKSVIKTLDPKQTPNAAPEVNLLRSQLAEKDRVIDELEKESEKSKVPYIVPTGICEDDVGTYCINELIVR